MKRDAVADVFARIGKAKVECKGETLPTKASPKTARRVSGTEDSEAGAAKGSTAGNAPQPERTAAEAYCCPACDTAMWPAICMFDGVFEVSETEKVPETESAVQGNRVGRKQIGNLYCCPKCGILKAKVYKEDNKEEQE